MGNVEGVFVSTDEEIQASLGKQVYFGEILGKHSEIYGDLENDDLTILSEDQNFIGKFMEIFPRGVGYNPLDYLEENR